MKTGVADLPLHYGRAPRWLFGRMVKLSKAITEIVVLEFGKDEFLRRISDPFWFQALSCVLGYDWHSSGTTTVTMGALKEGLKDSQTGITVLGGKGKASRKTPQQIEELDKLFSISSSKIEELKNASRLSAKVDNTALQDGFQLYHHTFVVSEDAKWSVIQQGMNDKTHYARRYHWLSEKVKSFVVEPHVAICCDTTGKSLNMVAEESEDCRKVSVDISKEGPNKIKKYLLMDKEHEIDLRYYTGIKNAYEFQPRNYEELLLVRGMGPKSIRALALISKLVYGKEPSWRDPAKYSFAHGGKDGIPYPVDRRNYDKSVEILQTAVDNAKINNKERLYAIKKLNNFINGTNESKGWKKNYKG